MSTIDGGPGNIVTKNLVLYLDAANIRSYPKTGNTWSDLAGSNNGTLTNGPTFNSANGGSIVFDGVNDYCEMLNFNNLSNYTLNSWAYFNRNVGETYHSIISKGSVFTNNSSFSFGLRRYIVVSPVVVNIYLYSRDTSTFGSEVSLGENVYQKWKYYTVTKDGNNCVFYMNGVIISSFTLARAQPSSSFSLKVGGPSSTPSTDRYFPGNIAQTSIYNRALTSTEVLQNFNATRARFGI